MSAHPPTRPCLPRRLVVLLAVLTTLAAVVLPTSGALAARPGSSAPTAAPDRIDLTVDGLDLPVASGSPALLVSADQDFAVTVTFRAGELAAPYSLKTATDVRITIDGGTILTTATVPAGHSFVTVSGLRLSAANGVTLTAKAVDRKAAADLASDTVGPFDVVIEADSYTTVQQRGAGVFINATGSAEPCQVTAAPDDQICVDAQFPNGVDSDVFFSSGLCTGDIGCREKAIVLQVLADLDDTAGALYTPTAPATLIVRCDKTLCGGGAIQSNLLQVNLDPVGDMTTSPACGAKNVMDGPHGHCVDYVQSKRDGSGDTYLYLLITRDARMMF